jgi:hypothetical protein
MTCLECGFLASDDFEVRKSGRILLACRGEAGCPSLEKLHCDRKLWVDYELGYLDDGREGLFDEVNKKRRRVPKTMRVPYSFEEAYGYQSPEFQGRVTLASFVQYQHDVQAKYGTMKAVREGGMTVQKSRSPSRWRAYVNADF